MNPTLPARSRFSRPNPVTADALAPRAVLPSLPFFSIFTRYFYLTPYFI